MAPVCLFVACVRKGGSCQAEDGERGGGDVGRRMGQEEGTDTGHNRGAREGRGGDMIRKLHNTAPVAIL